MAMDNIITVEISRLITFLDFLSISLFFLDFIHYLCPQNTIDMRIFVKVDGIVHECHSYREYFGLLFSSCLGKILAWIIVLVVIVLVIGYLLS